MRVLVTGGAGFIGSNFIRYLVSQRPTWQITNLDLLTYAGNLANLSDITDRVAYRFIRGDIANPDDVESVFGRGFDYVVNFAAETHVDRSFYDPQQFLKTNMIGTQVLLDAALKHGVRRFVQISSDEVYGSTDKGSLAEDSPLAPSSVYAVSKASADLLCLAHLKTYRTPVIITRSCNNYGPYQFPEKLIPFFVTRALQDQPLPLYGDGLNIRDWLHVEDNCRAILSVLEAGEAGEIYNIATGEQRTNLEITRLILEMLGKPESLIKFVKDRPGHDRRYALNFEKIRSKPGWQPQVSFEAGLKMTVDWYRQHERWWTAIQKGAHRQFVEKHYGDRR